MKIYRVLLVLFSALAMLGGAAYAEDLLGAGATFPEPLYAKMFDTYYSLKGDRINYQGIGSGGGIQQVQQKTVDFGGTDAYLSDSGTAKFDGAVLHIPIAMGAVVVTYNLPGKPTLRLTPDVIADLFLGKITKWNDARFGGLNPGVNLPADNIVVVHRSDGSGTTFVFTDYLAKVSPEWKNKVGADKAVKWPVGLGGKGNPGVAGLVQQMKGSVGYVELSYAQKNGLPYAIVKNKSGNFIKPSIKSVTLAADTPMPEDTRVTITDTDARDGYPISALTWILVYQEQNYGGRSASKSRALVKLLNYMITEGQQFCAELLYSPLSPDILKKSKAQLAKITFDGKPVK